MTSTDDTIQLISFEAAPAPEGSDATIALNWEVANATQVTIEGPGVGNAGLDRYTFYSGTGELHINTPETKASYRLTAAPDPKRLIQSQCDIDLEGGTVAEDAADPATSGEPGESPDETRVTQLGFKGIEVKKGICYVDHNSKQTLEWAYQNAEEASFVMVKGEVPNVPEGKLSAEGAASVGPFTDLKGAVLELKLSKPVSVSKTLSIRIKRAQITVTNDTVTPGSKATLSWQVESATAVDIIPFKGTRVPAPSNPECSGSMTFDVELGQTYEFKVEATSVDGGKSHKIMSATVGQLSDS